MELDFKNFIHMPKLNQADFVIGKKKLIYIVIHLYLIIIHKGCLDKSPSFLLS